MAKQHKRKQPKGKAPASKPITSNPLFPAVVALWFGALFGLGSLAVRPSLLESLVMKSRLDLVVPAAAPPLGITARILIALALAGLGGVIGAVFARRLARPKVEPRQRKRSARSADAEMPGYGSRSGPAAPFSVHDEIGAEADGPAVLTGRRRAALAIEHDEVDFVPYEMAPLPGGMPQVLDIAGIDLSAHAPAEDAAPPLDLAAFAEPAAGLTAAAPVDPFVPPPALAAAPQRQVFQPVPTAFDPAAAPPFAAPAAAPAQAEQSFAPPVSEPAPRQIFGMPIEEDHVDQSLVRAAGFKTTVFDQEEHEPLFPPRNAEPLPAEPQPAAPAPFAAPFTMPAASQPEPAPFTLHSELPSTPAALVETPNPAPVVAAAPAAPLPPVAGLGMTDLATRLKQSMERRRAAREGAEFAPDLATPAAVEQAQPVAAPDTFAVPQIQDAPQQAAQEAAGQASPVAAAAFEPVSVAPAFAPPAESLLTPAPAAAEADPAVVVPPAPLVMPAALRPISFDEPLDDDDMLASLLPPRHIAMPTPIAPAAAFAAPVEPVVPVAIAAEDRSDPASTDEAEEESYASLLDIGQPLSARSQFVRIDEPEPDAAEVEPVVIFPGQTPLGSPAPFAAAQAPFAAASPFAAPAQPASEAVPFRRFDAPSAAGQGGQVAMPGTQPAADPAEADQALRAALANLQRMSGAA